MEESLMAKVSHSFSLTLLLGPLALAACAGGGGAPSVNTSTVSSQPATSPSAPQPDVPPSAPQTYIIEPPAPATYGLTPDTAQFASPGGPSFDRNGGNLPAANTSFPALTSAMTFSGKTAADTADRSVTVTVLSATPTSTTLQFAIPSVGLVQATTNSGLPGTIGPQSSISFLGEQIAYQMNYVSFGVWSFGYPRNSDVTRDFVPLAGSADIPTQLFYAFGYETPASSIPISGTAAYRGTGTVGGRVWTTMNFGDLGGDASFSVDFASGKINGALTKVTASSYDVTWPWHDVSVVANIAAGTNKFTGATAASSQPPPTTLPSGLNLTNSATGHINGAFYGPAAQNLGALWSLSDGTGSALGWVGAH